MVMTQPPASPRAATGFRYLETPAPIHFPEEAEVPESMRHLRLRTALFQLLDVALPQATVGSDQFIYFDASDPKQCVAPDVYVRLSPSTDLVSSWKVWERGAPEIAVEFVSEFDRSERNWQKRFERYHRIGVRELLRFDPDQPQHPLRIWDRVEGALLEREVTGAVVPTSLSGVYWAIAPLDRLPLALRIASGPSLDALVPTAEERCNIEAAQREQEAVARRAEAEARRKEAEARRAAEARVAELEAELKRRG